MRAKIKKNLIVTGLSLLLIAAIGIGRTIAYFTDYDEAENTFTMGSIKIDLEEPNWDASDGLDILPGSVRVKDPTVTAVDGQSYMRIRMEIVDGDGNYITDTNRLKLIMDTLFYDTSYAVSAVPVTQNLIEGQKYSTAELQTLINNSAIYKEYNMDAFAFAGIETGNPAVRYYNYIANGGIFDAAAAPPDTAVLFSNIVISKDWNNAEIYILSGDQYTTTPSGGLEVTAKGTGYKLIIKAEAIQSAEMNSASEAFKALDDAAGITRDTSGT